MRFRIIDSVSRERGHLVRILLNLRTRCPRSQVAAYRMGGVWSMARAGKGELVTYQTEAEANQSYIDITAVVRYDSASQ